MRTVIMDVAAESGGALSILLDYYHKAVSCSSTENQFTFIISKPHIESIKNINVIIVSWVKKSWLHRIFFELFVAHKLVNKCFPEKVISLQNLIVLGIDKSLQCVYVHQSLPFSHYRFSLFSDPKLWFYKNIYGKFIIFSVRRANQVIVQVNWMKNELTNIKKIDEKKIVIIPPIIDMSYHYQQDSITANDAIEDKKLIFIYPASGQIYKNHTTVINALLLLDESFYSKLEVIFTLYGNENTITIKNRKKVEKNTLPVRYVGYLKNNDLNNYYKKSILLFPSYVETFGLPLLEAKMRGMKIIASDCEYSREVLNDYPNVLYFDPFDFVKLKEYFEDLVNA